MKGSGLLLTHFSQIEVLWFFTMIRRGQQPQGTNVGILTITILTTVLLAAQLAQRLFFGSAALIRFCRAYSLQQIQIRAALHISTLASGVPVALNSGSFHSSVAAFEVEQSLAQARRAVPWSRDRLAGTSIDTPASDHVNLASGPSSDRDRVQPAIAATGSIQRGAASDGLPKTSGAASHAAAAAEVVAAAALDSNLNSSLVLSWRHLPQLIRGWDALAFVCEMVLFWYCIFTLVASSHGWGVDVAVNGWQLPLALSAAGLWLATLRFLEYDPKFYGNVLTLQKVQCPNAGRVRVYDVQRNLCLFR
jgi:hypothetical protein